MTKYSAVVTMLILSACSTGETPRLTPSPAPGFSAEATHEPLPPIARPEPCEHLLWPLADGAVWRYQLARADGTTQSVTLNAEVSPDGSASLTLDMGAGPVENLIQCAPEGLYGALVGLTGHPDLGAGLTLANPDRPFLPSADRLLPLGSEAAWDARYTAGGSLSLPLAGGATEVTVSGGEVVLYVTTQPLESLSTPAGTFNVLPVEQTVFFNLQVTRSDGTPGSLFGDAQARLYWAEGIGLVRQTFEGGMLSSTLEGGAVSLEGGLTLELVAYHAPGGV